MAKTGLYLGNVAIGRIITASSSASEPNLQTKSVTPIKEEQTIVPDSGYDGLSMVNVAAIPEQYQDVSVVTADASDIVEGKKIVTTTGTVSGTMPDKGAISGAIDGINTETYVIPSGYHNGSGTVSLTNDIQNEVTTQENIIAEINAILNAKASAYPTITYDASTQTLSITEAEG